MRFYQTAVSTAAHYCLPSMNKQANAHLELAIINLPVNIHTDMCFQSLSNYIFFLLYIEFIRRDPVSHFMLLYLCSTKKGENKTLDMKKEIKMFLTYSRLTTLDKKCLI